MKIAITGINGFVGGSLANYLISKNHKVIGIGRQSKLAEFVNSNCNYVYADIANPISNFEADIVIHSAALASDTAKYEDLYKNNVIGTQNILNASSTANIFIQISTSSVYNFNNKPMNESDAARNYSKLSGYGQTKYLAEQKVLSNDFIPNKIILRPRAIYGINDRLILPRLLKLVRGNRLIIPKHITQNISLTHIDNLIAATELCIQKPINNKIYNVVDELVYSLDEVIIKLLGAVTEKKLKVINIPSRVWESLITINQFLNFNRDLSRFGSDQLTKHAILDITAIKNDLNYIAKKNIDNSYDEIANWVINSGGWEKYLKHYISIIKRRK